MPADTPSSPSSPERVAQFWKAALTGYDAPPPPGGHPTWQEWADANNIPENQRNLTRTLVDQTGNRPTIFFNQVPEGKPGESRTGIHRTGLA